MIIESNHWYVCKKDYYYVMIGRLAKEKVNAIIVEFEVSFAIKRLLQQMPLCKGALLILAALVSNILFSFMYGRLFSEEDLMNLKS